MKKFTSVCPILCLFLLFSVMIGGCSHEIIEQQPTTNIDIPHMNSGRHPSQYTWEEYQAMSEAQKEAFRKSFGSDAVFEAWKEMAQRVSSEETHQELPWEQGGKQPALYTWEEFEALTDEHQMAFQNTFESFEAFDAWKQNALYEIQLDAMNLPWRNGGKQPEEYTWEEFEALTGEQQMAFQNAFSNSDALDYWLQKNMPEATEEPTESVTYPWENGGKQPNQYTWAEFEALSADLQIAFQNAFSSFEAFDAWLQKNMPKETEVPVDTSKYPWENGGKQPVEYSWAEFETLSAELQMAFQNSFDSFEDFEAWMSRVNP